MKRFYELYPNAENLPQPVADSSVSNRPQAVDDSEQLVFCIPWGHNRTIIDKCRDNYIFKSVSTADTFPCLGTTAGVKKCGLIRPRINHDKYIV